MEKKIGLLVFIILMVLCGISVACTPSATAVFRVIPNNITDTDQVYAYVIKDKQVLFDASESIPYATGSIVRCEWDWNEDDKYDYVEGGVVHPDGTFDKRTWHVFTENTDAQGVTTKLKVTDSSGYTDTAEVTVVVSEDTDSDGLPNAYEDEYSSVLDDEDPEDADDDSESPTIDGFNNLQEYLHGTSPTTYNSSLPDSDIIVVPSGLSIQDTINASLADDIIILMPGTYNEYISFSSDQDDRTLQSIDPDNWEIVNGTIIRNNGYDTVTVTIVSGNSNTVVKGLTITGGEGGGISCSSASPVISNCVIRDNINPYDIYSSGPGINLNSSTVAVINNCFILNNQGVNGAGINLSGGGSAEVTNCVIYNNEAIYGYGGGVCIGGTMTIRNCTIVGNSSTENGGGIYNAGTTNIYNTIIWENEGDQIYGSPSTTNCHIQGVGGATDPKFSNINSIAGQDNICGTRDDGLRLRIDSPCIDTGNNTYAAGSTDITGSLSRTIDGDHSGDPAAAVDKGAYELNKIWHVDKDVPGGGNDDGTSWDDAYDDLQEALTQAVSGDEIWVAAATAAYKPGTNRSDSFELPEGVAVYGRFSSGDTDFTERNADNETILSGDIGTDEVDTDNSYHVVTGAYGASIDGFTIRDGYSNSSWYNGLGGGIYYFNSSSNTFSIRNCFITDNYSETAGGGIFINANGNFIGSVQIANCVITNNTTASNFPYYHGGGIYNYGSLGEIVNCTIVGNSSGERGGGVACYAHTVIENSIIYDNSAGYPAYDNIYVAASVPPFVSYSDIEGCLDQYDVWQSAFGNDCGGNMAEDPLFDSSSLSGLELQDISPCIDKGDNTLIHDAFDMVGNRRISNLKVDMGAYEYRLRAATSSGATVSGGEEHTMIIDENGRVFTCGADHGPDGYNQFQLGREGGNKRILLPAEDGEMDTSSELLEGITDVSAGWRHSLFLAGDGRVLSCGTNILSGCLGNNNERDSEVPVYVHAGEQNPQDEDDDLQYIIAIACGRSGTHSLAVEDADENGSGYVFAWGSNDCGQLGNGADPIPMFPFDYVDLATKVVDTPGTGYLSNIASMSGGAKHSMALTTDGYVYCFGSDAYGLLGINGNGGNYSTPQKVLGVGGSGDLANICAISAGWVHSMALEKIESPNCKGRVYCWGNNGTFDWGVDGGRLGNGYDTGSSAVPIIVQDGQQNTVSGNLENIIAISAGCDHSIALESGTGRVLCWGGNSYGQLGNLDDESSTTPVYVKLKDGSQLTNIVKISAGYWHNIAIDEDGVIYIWGSDRMEGHLDITGKLGLGGVENVNYAVPVGLN